MHRSMSSHATVHELSCSVPWALMQPSMSSHAAFHELSCIVPWLLTQPSMSFHAAVHGGSWQPSRAQDAPSSSPPRLSPGPAGPPPAVSEGRPLSQLRGQAVTRAPRGDGYLLGAASAARQSFGSLQAVRHKTGLATVSHLHFIQVGWQTAGSLEQPPPVLALCAASADSDLSSRCTSALCGSLESSASAPPARPATNRPTVTALTTPQGKNRLRIRNLRKDEPHRARPIRAPALGNRPQHTGKPRKGKRPPMAIAEGWGRPELLFLTGLPGEKSSAGKRGPSPRRPKKTPRSPLASPRRPLRIKQPLGF